jgi:hypothetical protein
VTDIEDKLKDLPDTSKPAPRWLLFGQIMNKKQPEYNGTAILLVMDSKKEQVGLLEFFVLCFNFDKYKHSTPICFWGILEPTDNR